MKSVRWKRWLVLAVICLPILMMVALVQTARRDNVARRHQHELNIALFQAAQQNSAPQVEALLAKGAEANALEHYEEPDVSLSALWQQWWKQMRGLPRTAAGTSEGTTRSAFSAALDNAAQTQFKDWRVLKLLADRGANVNDRGFMSTSQTALDWTTELQKWRATDYLLDHGADTSVTGMSGSNPFLQTVACDNVELVTKMLAKGAKVNFVPKDYGDTPLCCAVVHENLNMIRVLLEHGADMNLPNARGETPLHRCQGNEHGEQLVTLLLDRGADPNRKNVDGNTPLMAAARSDYAELVRLYLAHRADPAIRNKKGQTALDLAKSHHCANIVTLLTQAHATP